MTGLSPLDPEPVELLVAPGLVDPVELDEPSPPLEPLEPVEPDALAEPELPPEIAVPLVPAVPPVPVDALDPLDLVLTLLGVAVAADWACALRARAGSWPVTSTTVMSIHTARNRATEPPMTRARILRTRARRASLILMPSSLVMAESIEPSRRSGV
ncbi:MAG: hypothetical protein ACJ780_16720 [Solirubrobacteraceae bacterium]